MSSEGAARRILSAELLSIGSELTVGETRDTNSGELARSLTDAGVAVGRMTALPDRLDAVADAFRAGLERADLVVSTGGLGPTPDDLTREALAQVCAETPVVDAALERWLRELWARRNIPFPELNLKQAWTIPSSETMANPNGTAPGWFVSRPDGRVAVALPGPPREMRPMWADEALPRLRSRGLGTDVAVRTFRLMGVGESQVADVLGEELLRRPNPEVATYARVEAVDVRISAVGADDGEGRSRAADELVEEAAAIVTERLGEHIWAEGSQTWSDAIGARLANHAWRLAVVELGTRGSVGALFGDVDWIALAEARPDGAMDGEATAGDDGGLVDVARRIRDRAGTEVGLAVRARERGGDTAVTVAVVTPVSEHRETRRAFLGGSQGRSRAALTAASVLFTVLRDAPA
ncbi:MAG TPA: molybdopterin-binding protein [Methylomirabilota bacterium]|nr:molybdopterin-binding protein [Methylomirabilota bacterium]